MNTRKYLYTFLTVDGQEISGSLWAESLQNARVQVASRHSEIDRDTEGEISEITARTSQIWPGN